jgi:hypothetical protein
MFEIWSDRRASGERPRRQSGHLGRHCHSDRCSRATGSAESPRKQAARACSLNCPPNAKA